MVTMVTSAAITRMCDECTCYEMMEDVFYAEYVHKTYNTLLQRPHCTANFVEMPKQQQLTLYYKTYNNSYSAHGQR